MTTVGYGDVTMKSKPGKVFGLVWTLFGAISFCLLTGTLTTFIMNLDKPQDSDMMNKRVGVLKDRTFDTFVASQQGAVVHYNENVQDFYADVVELILKLQKEEVDGILLDSYTLKYVSHYMLHHNNSERSWMEMSRFFIHHTVRAQKTYEGQKLTYGMLIKNTKDFEFFKFSIAESRLYIELTWDFHWNRLDDLPPASHDVSEAHRHSSFSRTVLAIAGVFVVVMVFALFYELRSNRRSLRSTVR